MGDACLYGAPGDPHEAGLTRVLLASYRSDELHRRHRLRPLLTGWERVLTEVPRVAVAELRGACHRRRARRAGHGVAVLLKIYAHCIDGQATSNQRIADALGAQDAEEDPGDEDDGDTEQAC